MNTLNFTFFTLMPSCLNISTDEHLQRQVWLRLLLLLLEEELLLYTVPAAAALVLAGIQLLQLSFALALPLEGFIHYSLRPHTLVA